MSVLSLWVLLVSLFASHDQAGAKYLNKQVSPSVPPISAPNRPPEQDGGSAIDPIG